MTVWQIICGACGIVPATPVAKKDSELTPPPARQPLSATVGYVAPEWDRFVSEPGAARKTYSEQLQICRRAALAGDAAALYQLGLIYHKGLGVRPNFTEAFRWYCLAAAHGIPKALSMRGLVIQAMGPIQIANAQRRASQFAERIGLGPLDFRNFAVGVPLPNPTEIKPPALPPQAGVRNFLRKLLQYGGILAGLGFLIWFAAQKPERDLATGQEDTSQLRLSADRGHAESQYKVALLFSEGTSLPQDETKAAKWLLKAAEQGFLPAQKDLALRYAEGNGVKKSDDDAFKWYLRAANQNDPVAQNNIGVMLAGGQGTTPDVIESYKWLKLAQSQGNPQAQVSLEIIRKQMTPEQIAEGERRLAASALRAR